MPESHALPAPDAELAYWPNFLPQEEADRLFDALLETLDWMQHRVRIFGKEHPAPRLSAWYGDAGATYAYSGTRYQPTPWTAELNVIRQRVESLVGCSFNSVLCNRYRNGADSMGWHSDNESELGPRPVIASVSFGASRRFLLRHRTREEVEDVEIMLEHGSLLVMAGDCQACWKHRLPPTKRVQDERLNLTFRHIAALIA